MKSYETIWYDKQGNPITLEQASQLRYGPDGENYTRVGLTHIGETRVSTVWLGLDHSYYHDTKPIIFETMVFGGDHDQECVRYQTEQQAQQGHHTVVENLRHGREPFHNL